MRQILLLLTASFTFFSSLCQEPAAIDFDFTNKKVIFPPLKQALTKDDRYALNLPVLTYYTTDWQIAQDIWNPAFLPIKARYHQTKGTLRFDILAPGMSDLRAQPVRWVRSEVPDANGIPRPVSGMVRDFTCHFPCVLRIRDEKGITLDSIELSSPEETFTVTMHRDLLLSSNRPEYPKPVNPYVTEKDLIDAETVYREVLAKKAEQVAAWEVFQNRLVMALVLLYEGYNTHKQGYGWGLVKAAGRRFGYSDLDGAIPRYRAALDSLEAGRFDASRRIASELVTFYTGLLNSGEERIDKNVKLILYYNLSHMSMLSGDFTSARNYYTLFVQRGGAAETSPIATELLRRITLFELYGRLKANVKTHT